MSQANFNNELNSASYYRILVTKVINEQGEFQYDTLEAEGIEFPVEEIQGAGGYPSFDVDTGNYLEALDLLPGSYSELPQEHSIILQAGENVERSSEEPVDVKYEEDFELALKSNSIIRGNMEFKDEITMPLVSHKDGLFTCLWCDIGSTVCGDAKAIIAHARETHNQQLYICDVCGKQFRKRPQLLAHMNAHIATEEGDFQCEVCNRIFCSLRLFRIHKRMHNPQNKAWVCDICQKKYGSRNLLQEHYNTHFGVRPYLCNTCGKDFSSKYSLKAHMNTHLVRPRPFKCTHCESSFLSQQNLTQHLRIHLDIKEFSCPVCSKKFSTHNNLEVHSIVHTGLKPHACTICTKAFARKAELQDHIRTHTGERPYQCETCGAAFSQRSNLQSHKRATHLNDKRYKCETCGIGYKRRRLLDFHIKVIHTGERPYKCEECEATFVYPEHFKKHKNIHTGVKPYSCCICDKKFNSRDNRNSHLYIHSEKKPYECVVCKSGFMRKPQLFEHISEKEHWSEVIAVNQLQLSTDEYSNDGVPGYNIVTTFQGIAKTEAGLVPEGNSFKNISEGNKVLTDDKGFITLDPNQILAIDGNQYNMADVQIEYVGEVADGENQIGTGYILGSTEVFFENRTGELLVDDSSSEPYYFEGQLPIESYESSD